MAKRKQTLPAEIYVYEEMDQGTPYLVAEYDRDETAAAERRIVGTYRLVEFGEITTTAVYTKKR
jgi:hypothetical protein